MSNRRKVKRQPASSSDLPNEDMFLAAVDVVRRTGCKRWEVRWSPPENDGMPTVWLAIAEYVRGKRTAHLVGAALDPERAAFRLAEQALDGGRCQSCKRPVGITDHFEAMPLAEAVCWYQYDPELKTYRRGCE